MKLLKKQKDGRITTVKTTKKKAIIPTTLTPWKVLVVDDEHDVRAMTELGLKDFEFGGRPLHILHASSGHEAREILSKEDGIAVMLVDIMMETDDAGLSLINYIRNERKDSLMRIVVRTGQPGMHFEKTVIEQYDIDDYKNKTELCVDKLYLTMRMTLKGYRDLVALEETNRNLELKIQERTQQLEQQNKALIGLNRDKNEFLGIVAHDLKNPLQAIQGAAELIEMTLKTELFAVNAAETAEMLEFINMISVSADRMFNLIMNLLDTNAIETGQLKVNFQQFDVYPILKKVVNEYRKKAEIKHISIDFTAQSESYLAYADTNMLYQILDNLISNAIKYSPLNKQIFVRILSQAETIQIEIQDQGQGFSADDHSKLFGKYTRLSAKPTNNEHSTGLGLFIVKKLVKALHGNIYCESTLGQGATFILTIPKQPTL